jgi:hypothetical protein
VLVVPTTGQTDAVAILIFLLVETSEGCKSIEMRITILEL